MINHLMDVILHVLLFLINHHVFATWVILRSYYIGNNHIIILFCWNFQIAVTEVAKLNMIVLLPVMKSFVNAIVYSSLRGLGPSGGLAHKQQQY